ncbi:MAG: class I SAM-dependent methyltransferase [Rhodospirillales bacterium]|nr:class I SAM-dependent methyltransferase [Rhodospirillales bacterium]
MSVFYETYGLSKSYTTPVLTKKHIRRFDAEVWSPAGLDSGMRCLEIGCGTGHFLSYLHAKGVSDLKAIDLDSSLAPVIPADVRGAFEAMDVWTFIEKDSDQKAYDRIFMFDVFEHFVPEDGLKLLNGLTARLNPGGAIILKMPNASSPWGLQFQHGDLTHLAQYTPGSIRQMAVAADLTCSACWPHLLGSRSRQRLDRLLQGVLNRVVATPPEIWEGNFYARLDKPA